MVEYFTAAKTEKSENDLVWWREHQATMVEAVHSNNGRKFFKLEIWPESSKGRGMWI